MAHQAYENVVLGNKINDILTTAINLNDYMTIDTSLTENAGMKKKIITYTSTGNVEALAMGEGNTGSLEVQKSEDIKAIIEKMDAEGVNYQYVNDNISLFELVI